MGLPETFSAVTPLQSPRPRWPPASASRRVHRDQGSVMRWNPFGRKAGSPATALKSASFLFGMGAGRGALSNAGYDTLALEGYSLNAVVNACVNRVTNSV